MNTKTADNQLLEVAARIREMREIFGYSTSKMAELTEVTEAEYLEYEAGVADLPFSFIHKCALTFDVGITDLLEGRSAKLSSYTVTRSGEGQLTANEPGKEIKSIATLFRDKIAEPYWVRYEYSSAEQNSPIELATHGGQEFDIVLQGRLKVQVGDHIEYLEEGDSIYYKSSTPHGMIAVDGRDCVFLAVVLPGEEKGAESGMVLPAHGGTAKPSGAPDVMSKFVRTEEDEAGALRFIGFRDAEKFNFAFDVVDAIAEKQPERLAMLHVSRDGEERRFTFGDMKKDSARAANYLKSLGIKKGDRVMLVLRRNWQFWPIIVGLHKLGAVAIPATDQLLEKDFAYRFDAANVRAVICSAYGTGAAEAEAAAAKSPSVEIKIIANGRRDGWRCFDDEYGMFSSHFDRPADAIQGDDTMLMLFTSGTTGYPKAAMHSCKYPLGHYATAKYWHCVDPEGLHLTISDTGWGKALWGKLYGQWMCGAATFVYDFDRFHADDILPMFKKYGITTFCAPPTMYRFLIKEDLSKYDLSTIKYATTAGEAMNPEVFTRFREATGLAVMEGFGQTETTLVIGNFAGSAPKVGSMGKPSPLYDVELLDKGGKPVGTGEPGEIVIFTGENKPCGVFLGYYEDEKATKAVWHDGYYHTGDLAWRDEDGYFWYVGRADDVIKSSGYRIGPFEIENVIMELPYVLECGVSAAADEIRGQVVKASVVLTRGTAATEELKAEIQSYVKARTAPYKYPRIVVFRDELPKTTSGKIIHNQL